MPMIKFRLLGENFKFGKLISVTVNLAASWYSQVYLRESAEKLKIWFLTHIRKCVKF
jgi:hypothetical protein